MSSTTTTTRRPAAPNKATKKAAKKATAKRAATKKATNRKTPAKKRTSKAAGARTTSTGAAKRSTARKRTASKSAATKRATTRSSTKRAASSRKAARKSTAAIGGRSKAGARNLTQRAQEVRAARRQRRKSVVVVLLALSIATAAGIALIRSPLLAIDSVRVTGQDLVSEGDVVGAAAIPIGSPLLDLPMEDVQARVEALPEIHTATIIRNWSGRVTIDVTEREPTMALRTPVGYALVDNDGRQVRTTTETPDGFLPVIGLEASGIPGDPAPPGSTAVLRLMEEITPQVRAAVSDVVVTGDQMALRLVEGGRVVLGDDRELKAKVVSLETLLVSVDLRCTHEIDLTVPSAPALSRIGEKGNPRDGLADLTQCS